MSDRSIQIDGAWGEGGGQMVRTALALSTLTGQAFVMERIRAGRPKPGLKAQHLTAIRALERIAGAKVDPVAVGSERLAFRPGKVIPGPYDIDIGTAGSISLLLQALFLPLMFAGGETTLRISGGTCGKWQAPVEYTQHVLLPYLQKLAVMDIQLIRRGYYPRGGGVAEVRIIPRYASWQDLPGRCPPFDLSDAGPVKVIRGISFADERLRVRQVAERQAAEAQRSLEAVGVAIQIDIAYQAAHNPGSGIVLWMEMAAPPALPHPLLAGADGLGERGKTAEAVGAEAAAALLDILSSRSPVDAHLADQLIPFLALLPGSRLRTPALTGHLQSNIHVVEQFLPVRFSVREHVTEVLAV